MLQRMYSTTRTTVLSRERSLTIQYTCREKMDVNFSKWLIVGISTESAIWSTINSMFARLGTDYEIRNQWFVAVLEVMITD